jgi:uroporphyrin-3 C-methyltransferase
MSKKIKDTPTKSPDVEEISADEAGPGPDELASTVGAGLEVSHEVAPEAVSESSPTAGTPQGKGNSAIAWLALIVALPALAGLGFMIVDDWKSVDTTAQSNSSIANLDSRLAATQESVSLSVSDLDRNIAALSDANADFATRLESQQRSIDERIRLLDSLPIRMSGLESSVASLKGVSAGARDTWLLAEAEYYMQIANAQLQLAGNPHLAMLALHMADERLVQLGNPALIEVRTAVSDELAALDVMDKPDIEGATLTLSSLAQVVDSLPLRDHERASDENSDDIDTEELSGVDRAVASMKDAMSGLIKITPPDQAAMPLVTPGAEYFLRTNLTLQIQVARLALLRGETAVFEQSLNDASSWLHQYFDAESTQVAAALQTIDEIRGGQFAIAAPDISNSLRLLRQFRTLAETAQ